MPFETIIVTEKERHIHITLNRPDAMNSISPLMMEELNQALDHAEKQETLCALSISGKGRAFCAGVDLKEAKKRMEGQEAGSVNSRFLDQLRLLLLRLENFPSPVIAAVNGLALAGGLEFVLACDLVLAAKSAKFGDAHANYGLVPGGGSSVRLPRKIGVNRAKQMIYTGEFLEADILLDWGLVNAICDDADLEDLLGEWVGKLSSKSPIGLKRMKRMVEDGQEQALDAALRYELSLNALHAASYDRIEGLAAFNEKRKPDFKGR